MKNEPVAVGVGLGALVTVAIVAVINMLVAVNVLSFNPDQVGAIRAAVEAIVAVIVAAAPLVSGVVWARSKVTPVANPKTADGQPAALVALDKMQ